MLYLNTVEPKTLELLNKLQKVPEFSNLRLVGGTGLSLQYGHRKSVDIDLFGKIDINNNDLTGILSEFGKIQKLNISKSIKIYMLNDVKLIL